MQLFYNPNLSSDSVAFTFEREESKHIVKVLRKKEGDNLFVTNGLGFLFKTEITLASDSKCMVKIISYQQSEKPFYYLHLAVAPTKMNDRYEWFLEKATEIGISEISPIICDHSERTQIKTERMEKIVQSAMKQSLHYYLPKLNEPVTFREFLKKEHDGQLFIAHCEESDKKSLKYELAPKQKVTILIGPEGDFSAKEVELAVQNGCVPVSLGNTRLRTETAAIVACHSVAFVNE